MKVSKCFKTAAIPFLVISIMLLIPPQVPADGIGLTAETGFLAVVDHKIQFSQNGTYFDYDAYGGQDVLFPVLRFSVNQPIGNRHELVWLYQPLKIETRAMLTRDLVVDDMTFPADSAVRFLYNFPFYRLSYMYALQQSDQSRFDLGLSLQIRNATIEFESLDGARFRSNGGVGPVPAIKVRWIRRLGTKFWAGTEMDGMYAPVSYLNGSDEEITGAILDASLRGGMDLKSDRQVFLNLRYLGGGAVGTNTDDVDYGDGYVKNWLHFLTVTMGFTVSL